MKFSIIFSFFFLGLYSLSALMSWDPFTVLCFSLSPLVVLYVVYKVLRDPQEVQVSFEDHFYQDGSHPRRKS